MLCTGKFVTSSGIPAFSIPFIGGVTLIQLWHGVPLKQIGVNRKEYHPRNLIEYDYLFVNSKMEIDAFSIYFDEAIVSGYPRNDIFHREIDGSDIGVRDGVAGELKQLRSERTVIGYFPTWRRFYSTDAPINFERLDRELDDMDAHLLIKPHRSQEYDISTSELNNVTFHPPSGDLYPLFEHIDVLITDYSSICFDFLHLDRPIIYFPYDLETYREKRGFYLDYESATPGPKAHDFDELVDTLYSVCERDEYNEERAEVYREIFKHRDGMASQRIINSVQNNGST